MTAEAVATLPELEGLSDATLGRSRRICALCHGPGQCHEEAEDDRAKAATVRLGHRSALTAKLIDSATGSFWQVVTALGLTVTPLLAKLGRWAARRLERPEEAEQQDTILGDDIKGRVIILGFGRVGRMVAEMLDAHGKAYVAIDADVDAMSAARKDGFQVAFGDVARPELIERLAERAPSAFILTMDNPVLVNRLVRKLRRAFPVLPIVARARDTAHAAELYKAGVSDAVLETLEASLQLSEAALVDLGVAMGPVIASIHEKRHELRAQIKAEAELEEAPRQLGGRRLRDAAQPSEAGSNLSTPAV